MSKERWAIDHVQRLCVGPVDDLEAVVDLLRPANTHEDQFHPQRRCGRLEVLDRSRMVGRGASLSSCNRLALSSASMIDSPVTFAPGRDRLATRPSPTGSATIAMTMGMADVARWAALVAAVVSATITSTRR